MFSGAGLNQWPSGYRTSTLPHEQYLLVTWRFVFLSYNIRKWKLRKQRSFPRRVPNVIYRDETCYVLEQQSPLTWHQLLTLCFETHWTRPSSSFGTHTHTHTCRSQTITPFIRWLSLLSSPSLSLCPPLCPHQVFVNTVKVKNMPRLRPRSLSDLDRLQLFHFYSLLEFLRTLQIPGFHCANSLTPLVMWECRD